MKIPTKIPIAKISYSHEVPQKDMPVITGSDQAAALAMDAWEDIDLCESFAVMLMTNSNRVMGMRVIATGGIAAVVVDARLILQAAVVANATAVILVHNHPGGSTEPSELDLKLTKELKRSCELCKIDVLDHIIITGSNGYFSFSDKGII